MTTEATTATSGEVDTSIPVDLRIAVWVHLRLEPVEFKHITFWESFHVYTGTELVGMITRDVDENTWEINGSSRQQASHETTGRKYRSRNRAISALFRSWYETR